MRKIITIIALSFALLLPGCAPMETAGIVVGKETYYQAPVYINYGSICMPTGGGERHKLRVECNDGKIREVAVTAYDYESYEIGDVYPRGGE